MVYKSQNGLGPKYICDMFREYKPSRALRSNDSGQLVQSRVQTEHGEATFSCYAANKWNKLPVEIKLSPNVNIFKNLKKTYLDCCFSLIILIILFVSLYILLCICIASSTPCCNAFILCKALLHKTIVWYMKCAIQLNLT